MPAMVTDPDHLKVVSRASDHVPESFARTLEAFTLNFNGTAVSRNGSVGGVYGGRLSVYVIGQRLLLGGSVLGNL